LFLAVIGLLASMLMIGFGLNHVLDLGLMSCLLIGVIASATDPIAVVALFKEAGAPKRLATLVEGESLFNDATAIVLFTLIIQLVIQPVDQGYLVPLLSFAKVFFGGALVGVLLSFLTCFIVKFLSGYPESQMNMTVVLAYGSFMIGEHYFHVSGVMAVVFSAFVLSLYGRTSFSGNIWSSVHMIWQKFSFWSNTLVFLLMGLLVVDIFGYMKLSDLYLVFGFIFLAHLARFIVIFGFLPLLTYFKLIDKIEASYRSVMFWGGLRGTISLLLVIMIMENPLMPEDLKHLSAILVTSLVMFTLFINATTVGYLMKLLRLGQLNSAQVVLRNRAIDRVYHKINEQLPSLSVVDQTMSQSLLEEEKVLLYQSLGVGSQSNETLTMDQWQVVALKMLLQKERIHYIDLAQKEIIDSDTAQKLVFLTDNMSDVLEEKGYVKAFDQCVQIGQTFRLARWVNRHLGISKYMIYLLQSRLDQLSTIQSVWKMIEQKDINDIYMCIDPNAVTMIKDMLRERAKRLSYHLSSISSQYPLYADQWNKQDCKRKMIHAQISGFDQLKKQSIISEEIYDNVVSFLEQEFSFLKKQIKLDIGQKPTDLIRKVAFFSGLSDDSIREIAKVAKPVLYFPGEAIFHRGDIGKSMYFISSGSVEVMIEPESVMLGTGDFFGELAILNNQPRVADVNSIGYCDLLEISQSDFLDLMKQYPDMWEQVQQEVAKRQQSSE